MPTLLVIDDEESVRYSFRHVFEDDDVEVLTAGDGGRGAGRGPRRTRPTWSSSTCSCPTAPGWTSSSDIQALDPKRPVIFITAHGTTETAIEAMKRGAFDYLSSRWTSTGSARCSAGPSRRPG